MELSAEWSHSAQKEKYERGETKVRFYILPKCQKQIVLIDLHFTVTHLPSRFSKLCGR